MITRTLLVAALAIAPWASVSLTQEPAIRNPRFLRASELLGRAEPGVAPRIRFEWEHVPGCREYVLSGQWTDAQSWTVRSSEHRVTARNATSWGAQLIAFDLSLPEGNHSWRIVAVFGSVDRGDFQNPAHLSFTVK